MVAECHLSIELTDIIELLLTVQCADGNIQCLLLLVHLHIFVCQIDSQVTLVCHTSVCTACDHGSSCGRYKLSVLSIWMGHCILDELGCASLKVGTG